MNARQIVFKLLLKVQKNGAYSNLILDNALKASALSEQDKAFSTALFYGTLERQISLDTIITSLTRNKDLDDYVLVALRMGLYQIDYMNSVPDSAAVNESVELVRDVGAKGFVNAVLREYLRNGADILDKSPKWAKYSCPEWLYDKWAWEYGDDTAEQIAKNTIGAAPVVCRMNNTKISEEDFLTTLANEGVIARAVDNVENAFILEKASVSELDAYKNGLFHIEDISAQRVCIALEPKENETVFDLCAAPGGKTFTMAEMMNNKGRILAFDLHENRVRLIKSGAERLGLDIIEASVGNATVFNAEIGLADKVLCDVPCSGLGIIRRKPEIKYKKEEEFTRLPEIQFNILSNGAKYVKVGGTLVYSTCTLSKAENENVIDRFLDENRNFVTRYIKNIFPNEMRDGFFIAKLERKS